VKFHSSSTTVDANCYKRFRFLCRSPTDRSAIQALFADGSIFIRSNILIFELLGSIYIFIQLIFIFKQLVYNSFSRFFVFQLDAQWYQEHLEPTHDSVFLVAKCVGWDPSPTSSKSSFLHPLGQRMGILVRSWLECV
jgi:hypothetical protein